MSGKRPVRAVAPVRFAPDNDEDDLEIDNGDEENGAAEVISLVQQFQRKTAKKQTNQSAAFQARKNQLISKARKDGVEMVREGSAYIEQCKLTIEQLRSQEIESDQVIREAMNMWASQESSIKELLSLFPPMINDLASQRAHDINAANEMLEMHPQARQMSRRKAIKAARRAMKVGLENQKLATDASALVKSYKQLLLS